MTEHLDDSKQTLTEHLTELRGRLIWSFLAIIVTSGLALIFAEEILDYSISPLSSVMRAQNRVNALLVDRPGAGAVGISERLEEHPGIHFGGHYEDLEAAGAVVTKHSKTKESIDLVLVSLRGIRGDITAVSDHLEGVEDTPFVAFLVEDVKSSTVTDLWLEGAVAVRMPPRDAVLNRVIKRAAAAAGKAAARDKLHVLSPLDPFFAYIKIALVVGLFLACPIWLYQAWLFVAPGLYSNEKKIALPVVLSGSILFVCGGLFAYYVMFPMMFDVLINQMMPESLSGSFTVDKYLGLLLRVTVAFGVVFELPLAIAVLAGVGVVNAAQLSSWRKYWAVLSFVIGAFLTPADPLSQAMMAAPLIVFYELGILLARILARKEGSGRDEGVLD